MKILWRVGSVVLGVVKEMGDAFILCHPLAVLPYKWLSDRASQVRFH